MCARLDSYLKLNNILCINQFGFCKNSNTSDAIIELLNYVYSSLGNKQSTIAVYLDFSKAFDTVNHNILMSNLVPWWSVPWYDMSHIIIIIIIII